MIKDKILFHKLLQIDWLFVLIILLLSCCGFAMLYSAAHGSFLPWSIKQITRFSIFLPIMIFIAILNTRVIYKFSYVFYFFGILALVATKIWGIKIMGAQRWIHLFGMSIQPSEMMNIFIVLALAKYFHNISYYQISRLRSFLIPTLIIALPAFITMKQPDLGTSLIMIMIGGIVFFVIGIKFRTLIFSTITAIAFTPLIWSRLHGYQQRRILSFFNPGDDPLGKGYNILQSKIAIGSGNLFGKGFLKGSQSHLSFLPEKHTDFIFTMIAEEFGFIGSLLIISLYAIIIIIALNTSIKAKSIFNKVIAVGSISIISIHLFINVFMVTAMIPVVGSPLPFISYGGTIMITTMVCCGLIMNSHLNKDNTLHN